MKIALVMIFPLLSSTVVKMNKIGSTPQSALNVTSTHHLVGLVLVMSQLAGRGPGSANKKFDELTSAVGFVS